MITFKGAPLTLQGKLPAVGQKAPDFTILDASLAPVTLAQFKGQIAILVSVPSLDTPVCDTETRRFNDAAQGLGRQVVIATISMDLPFAQARWCGAAGVKHVKTFSDHREASFGLNYGVLIKEWRLLARAVFVLDRQGIVRYVELVPEVTQEPNYAAALAAVAALK